MQVDGPNLCGGVAEKNKSQHRPEVGAKPNFEFEVLLTLNHDFARNIDLIDVSQHLRNLNFRQILSHRNKNGVFKKKD